jgi:ABC-type lipoprotein export system ATPase subunit
MLKLENLTIKFDKSLFINQSIYIKNNCITLIVGKSGCGKTTLLYKLGLIDFHKNDGQYYIDDKCINDLSDIEKTLIRRHDIAFVFQDYILYNHFNVYENIQYYASIAGKSISKEEIQKYLNKVHLNISLDRMIYTLSSGQRQRLAIACSLVKEARILILDEPTSAIDEANTIEIFKILKEIKEDKTIIITSHNSLAKNYCDEMIEITDGQINKVKTMKIEESHNKLEIKKSFLPLNTYIDYIKKQYVYMKKTKYFIMFANIIILLFCIISTQVIQYYTDQSKSLISLNQSGWMYIPSLQESEIKSLDVDQYYPYYETSLLIEGESYSVVPYYNESVIDDKIWTEFDLTNEKGLYLSQSLFYKYRNSILPTKYVNFLNPNTSKNVKILYKGVLLKGVESEYIESNEFIYMPYSLINEKLKPTEIKGYTLFCNSYDKYVEQKEILENKGYKVITYNEFNDIQAYIEKLDIIQKISACCIIVIGIFILGYLYRTYINERAKEFTMLKVLGLTNSNITALTFFETLIMSIIGTLAIIIVILFIGLPILRICLYEMIILLFEYLFIRFMIIRLKPFEVLRNQ